MRDREVMFADEKGVSSYQSETGKVNESIVSLSVGGICCVVADVLERIGTESFGQLGKIETLWSNGLALRFD